LLEINGELWVLEDEIRALQTNHPTEVSVISYKNKRIIEKNAARSRAKRILDGHFGQVGEVKDYL